jgi:2-oxoisovalerate ferredoxin oxidoreductase beta subunit
MGVVLARAACAAGKFVSWYPSYGPEQRGGTANCAVVVSGQPIGSPVVYEADVLVAMNRPSLDKFLRELKPGGLLLTNANIGDYPIPAGVRALAVPAQDLAAEGGNPGAANLAMLGVLSVLGGLNLDDAVYARAIAANFAGKPQVIAQNQAVFQIAQKWGAARAP